MKQHPFEIQAEPIWQEYQEELGRLKKKQKSSRFPALYRRICHHLAISRERGYSAALVHNLEIMVTDGHDYFYQVRSESHKRIFRYLAHGFPQAVRRHRRWVFVATLLFLLPLFATLLILEGQPHWVYFILSDDQLDQFATMYDPTGMIGAPREVDSQVGMWAYYIYNNVSIDFKAFAGGIVFGIGTVIIMVYNGLIFGAIASHIHDLGYEETFYSFVVGHSSLELVAMVLAGAAGLLMGKSLIAPGPYGRLDALRLNAKESLKLLIGAAIMTFLAAFIEAYWSSRSDISAPLKYWAGAGLWSLTLAYFLALGQGQD